MQVHFSSAGRLFCRSTAARNDLELGCVRPRTAYGRLTQALTSRIGGWLADRSSPVLPKQPPDGANSAADLWLSRQLKLHKRFGWCIVDAVEPPLRRCSPRHVHSNMRVLSQCEDQCQTQNVPSGSFPQLGLLDWTDFKKASRFLH